MKTTVASLLLILSVILFYLSYSMGIWAPAFTGIGFAAIALVFFTDR